MSGQQKGLVRFGNDTCGILLSLTSKGVVVTGWYDHIVSIEGGCLTWEEFVSLIPRTSRKRLLGKLRLAIEYKARLAGVPVVLVDPRNTSRTCPECGTIDKANRPTRDHFCCVSCGFAGPADTIAAENIRRAAVNQPDAVGA